MAKLPKKLRQEVEKRAAGLCEYCRSNSGATDSPYDIDHINPRSKGGSDSSENLSFSCRGCNISKYNKTKAIDPLSKKEVFLFNPRSDIWYEHFDWSYDYTLVIGRTRIGRATVEALRLNRPSLVELRISRRNDGKHPPD
jgi:HNH endonuclease